MLQKGELNPDTLAKYKPFIDKLFPQNVRNTNTAIHRDQGGATQPLLSMVFFGRQPNDPDLKRVFNKDLAKRKPTWDDFMKNIDTEWKKLPQRDTRKGSNLWDKAAELISKGATSGNYVIAHENVVESEAMKFTLDFRTSVYRTKEMQKVGLNLKHHEIYLKVKQVHILSNY